MRVAEWLALDGPVARRLANYEVRPQQIEMARAVAGAFERGEHLAVEAGTGIGKTFAYLLPAIDRILADPDCRVVVSTHTIALQEQLFHKDIPLLREALGESFSAELVKGRNNYVGLRRLKQASQRQKQVFGNRRQLEVLHEIEDWAYETRDGSRSDLPRPPPADVWEKVRSEHGNCLGRRCPTYEPCFYQRARRRAEQAQLLVVNHALLVADLLLRRENASVLPDYDLVIVDEAHVLEQVASDQFGTSVASSQAQYLLSSLFNDRTGRGYLAAIGTQQQRELVVSAAAAATGFFNSLFAWQGSYGRSNGRIVRENIVENRLSAALGALCEGLAPLREQLPRPEDQYELQAYLDRAQRLAQDTDTLLAQSLEEHVYWLDLDPPSGRRVTLCAAPLDPGPLIRTLLFDRVSSVILTSATLAAAGDDGFAYLLGRLGSPPAAALRLGSPFDFEQQVTVHVEAGMPDPSNKQAFESAAAAATCYHVRATEGRAFVLCTSYATVAALAALIRDELSVEDYTILVQGEALPRSKMLEKFKGTPRAVLIGTDSFWQGVDVAGEALSNVTIVKLPFAVPDRPTVEARIDLIRRNGGQPFRAYQLPEAILKFRQGFGRLIRSRSDRGVVVVLDPRVVRKSYGRQFLESLPKCTLEIAERPW